MHSSYQPKLLTAFKEGYTKEMLAKDIVAGIIVGIIALPMAIAFAIASGARPEEGLITAVVAGILAGALSGSRYQISGPTGAFVILVFETIQKFGYQGLLIATLIAGIILILMGLFRFGKAMMFVPYPVIIGFTAGIALFIFTSQLHDLLGLSTENPPPPGCLAKWGLYACSLQQVNPWSLLIGCLSILCMALTPKFIKNLPGPLVAISLATLIAYFFSLPVDTIGSRFGEIHAALPTFSFPEFSFMDLPRYIKPAIGIALLAGIESLLSASVADGITGRRHRSNAELISQGVANIGSALAGGLPATGAIARTAANIRSGAVSPLAAVFHSISLLLMLYFISDLVALIPMPALAGILIVVAYNMSEWRLFAKLLRSPKEDIAILLTTFGLTIFVDLIVAIEAGIILAAMIFLTRMASTSTTFDIKAAFNEEEKQEDIMALKQLHIPKGTEIYEILGPLFFAAAEKFKTALSRISTRPQVLILRMRSVPHIDASGMRVLEDIYEKTKKEGTVLVLSGIKKEVRRSLDQAGLLKLLGDDNVQPDINHALQRAAAICQDQKNLQF